MAQEHITEAEYDTFNIGEGTEFTTKTQMGMIENLQYPPWLGTDRINDYSQMHYVVIYINEVNAGPRKTEEDSEAWKSRFSSESPMSYSSRSTTTSGKIQNSEMVGGIKSSMQKGLNEFAQSTKAGADANQDASKKLDEQYKDAVNRSDYVGAVGAKLLSVFGTTAAFAGGGVAGLAEGFSKFIEQIGPRVAKLKTIVALPVPDMLNVSYSADWQTGSGAEIANMLNMAETLKSQNGAANVGEKLAGMMAYNGAMAATNAMGNMGNLLTKTTYNERKEGVYLGQQPRFFSFQWTFYPENANDSKALWDIIQALKYYSLPEEDTTDFSNGRWLIQPAIFDIEFWSHNRRNDWIPRTLSCALSKIDVNYTPTGKFATFDSNYAGLDGAAPVGISIGLEFQEIETLTKQRITDDDYMFFTNDKTSTGGLL